MTELVLLALAAIFVVIVAPIWALLGLSALKRRVTSLEDELAALRQSGPAPQPTAQTTVQPAATAPQPQVSTPAPPAPAPKSPWPQAATAAAAPPPPPPPEPAEPKTPGRFVVTGQRAAQLANWLRENWFIAVAAISLGLAGVFFVQYGIDNGLLSPRLRVLSAIGLGLALIAGGEVLRRCLGDDHDLAAFVPSAFSGAGLVAIFAGILSARQLYGLIGPTPAFVGLSLTALAAIALGWFYGPFLIAFGIIGATVAPFLVGGSSTDPWILFYYFALIAGAGLAVDALKRTAWISTLAMALPTGAAWLIWTGTSVGAQHAMGYAMLLALLSITLPTLSLRPTHAGPTVTQSLISRGTSGWPEFPTRLATGGALIAASFAAQAALLGEGEFWLAIITLSALFAAAVLWLPNAPALDDIGLLAGVGFLGILTAAGFLGWPALDAWTTATIPPEGSAPRTMTILTALGLGLSALAAIAGFSGRPWGWTAGAALIAPLTLIALDLFWQPLRHLTPPTWALHGIAVAAAMTFGALRARTRMPDAPLATSLFVLSAITMTGFACVILLTKTALTLAFALLAATAAWLDRRFTLAPLTLFVKVAALACSYRLIIDPGVLWAFDAPWLDVALAYIGTIALLAAAWYLLGTHKRHRTRMVVESVTVALIGIAATVALFRILDDGASIDTHWSVSLFALIWLISATAQIYRSQAGFRTLRLVLAATLGTLGLLLLGVGVMWFNPVIDGYGENLVRGVPILSSLMVAYALPALLIGVTAVKAPNLPRWTRLGSLVIAIGLAAFWIALEIRFLWRGPDLSAPGVTDPELYSYTIALIVLSAGLLATALIRRSSLLRKLGLAAAAVAVAKVFLLDASGLTGLIRVFSFLALGLSLAGLALINRWIIRLQHLEAPDEDAEPPTPDTPEPDA